MEDDDFMQGLIEMSIDTQARSLATHLIVVELMRALAASQPDPRKFLSVLYERTMHRAGEGEFGEKKAATAMRDSVERFFANQVKWLPSEGGSPNG